VRSGRAQCQRLQSNDGAGLSWSDLAVAEGFEAILAVPIFAEERVKFVLRILVRQQDGFGDEEIRLLESLGQDLSHALHVLDSLNRYDAVSAEKADAVGRLKTVIYEVIEAFGAAIDKLDPYTAGHEARVSDLAVRIARRMGMAPERLEGLMLGGLIHDIGKIGVPLQILTKPGRLTPEEFALVKSHVEAGYEVMKNIQFPWPINRIIREHHERLDGSGYPAGLKGDEICLEAQIVAVADVAESMTSHRPYRPALKLEVAVAELQRGKGSLYNVSAVEACLQEMACGPALRQVHSH
jgi:putative nucleotidyltransferase with HDIG domain